MKWVEQNLQNFYIHIEFTVHESNLDSYDLRALDGMKWVEQNLQNFYNSIEFTV
jgi:hypothetical protein